MNEEIAATVRENCCLGKREKVLAVFRDCREHFACIPLQASQVEASQAINDVQREKVILNDVEFFGAGDMFLDSLTRVITVLTQSPGYTGSRSAAEIRERILCKASRTTSGSDSYFTVEKLVGSARFLLKPRDGPQPPIRIEVYLVDNSIHSVVTCSNHYGLFDLGEIDDASQSVRLRKPTAWLDINTTVVEKADYRTQRNVRYLRIEVPEALEGPVGTPSSSTQSDWGAKVVASPDTVASTFSEQFSRMARVGKSSSTTPSGRAKGSNKREKDEQTSNNGNSTLFNPMGLFTGGSSNSVKESKPS